MELSFEEAREKDVAVIQESNECLDVNFNCVVWIAQGIS